MPQASIAGQQLDKHREENHGSHLTDQKPMSWIFHIEKDGPRQPQSQQNTRNRPDPIRSQPTQNSRTTPIQQRRQGRQIDPEDIPRSLFYIQTYQYQQHQQQRWV